MIGKLPAEMIFSSLHRNPLWRPLSMICSYYLRQAASSRRRSSKIAYRAQWSRLAAAETILLNAALRLTTRALPLLVRAPSQWASSPLWIPTGTGAGARTSTDRTRRSTESTWCTVSAWGHLWMSSWWINWGFLTVIPTPSPSPSPSRMVKLMTSCSI